MMKRERTCQRDDRRVEVNVYFFPSSTVVLTGIFLRDQEIFTLNCMAIMKDAFFETWRNC